MNLFRNAFPPLIALTTAMVACGGATREYGPDGGDGTGGTRAAAGGAVGNTGGRKNTGGFTAAGGRSGNTGGQTETGGTSTGGQSTKPDDTNLYAADYDLKCVVDGDCTLVEEGDQCCFGCMSPGAITRAALGSWDNDRGNIGCPTSATPCPGESPDPRHCEGPHFTAVCASGRCKVHTNVVVDPDKYDKTCAGVEDCVPVSAGEICGCQCGGNAVSKAGYAQLQKDTGGGCDGTPLACPCVYPGTLSCVHANDGGTGECTVTR